MTNLLVLPVLLPLLTAVLLIFFGKSRSLQRVVSGISASLSLATAVLLVYRVNRDGILTLHLGGWEPPYGIVFVGDMLAAVLVLAASVASLAILLYSFGTMDEIRERHYYYSFFHFLLVGVNGSFLTGDIFNLFVFFEVMLMSSYALLVLGGSRKQLKETVKYLVINIVSSTLFVAAVAFLYAAAGTLNMAHLSVRVAELGQGGVLDAIAILFLIVFSLKAGLLLFFWLPDPYAAPPFAVRAIFGALLTKVGLYAIIRVSTLIFYHHPETTQPWIALLAAASMILGGFGAASSRDLPRVLNYNVIIGVGFAALGLTTVNADALGGMVFYLLHDMVAKGLMFILGGMIITSAGTDRLDGMGGLIKQRPILGWMFFTLALALAGIPPLSGFPGKALLLRGALDAGQTALPLIGLASSLLVLYSLLRVFMQAFWGEEQARTRNAPIPKSVWAAAFGLLAVVVALGAGGEAVLRLAEQAGDTLAHPQLYIDAVLGGR